MRTLTFTPDDKETYEVLYSGLTNTSKRLNGTEIRVADKILSKFENIGKPVEGSNGAMFTLYFNEAGGVVMLEDAEYSLAKQMLEDCPWVPSAHRKIAKALEWYDNTKAG